MQDVVPASVVPPTGPAADAVATVEGKESGEGGHGRGGNDGSVKDSDRSSGKDDD